MLSGQLSFGFFKDNIAYWLSSAFEIRHVITICIPESFNVNTEYFKPVFEYKITFVNSQHENTNTKLEKSGVKKTNLSQQYDDSYNIYLLYKITF